jgi:NAD(P)-dependent dehydrogenase (short-subunit alcohol dehydrogenase family)/acyl dehydratase
VPLFTESDLTRFAEASGDVNPLHMVEDYAHRTPFGERVVFGVLSTLRALAHVAPAPEGHRPKRLSARFHAPMHLGRDYVLESTPTVVGFLEHGKRVATVSVAWTDEPNVGTPVATGAEPRSMRLEALDLTSSELAGVPSGQVEVVRYTADVRALRELVGTPLPAWSDPELAVLACASYLAGMEMPGQQALLLEVDAEFHERGSAPVDGLEVCFGLSRYDDRFGLVTLTADVRQGGLDIARVRVRALRRPSATSTDVTHAATYLPSNHAALAGRRAVVVGGSRGLGAQLVAQLAVSGAQVDFTYARSQEAADKLVADLGPTALPVRGHQGDARDPQFWTDLAASIPGGVDLVICSAWPVFAKLGDSPSAVTAAVEHVSAGLAMVAGPLLAFLPAAVGTPADVVVLSSELVNTPDAAYWHYATGKAAVEGLCRAVAPAHPAVTFHLVRPSMLATDYAQSAVGQAPMDPAEAARIILEQCGRTGPGVHELDIPAQGLG